MGTVLPQEADMGNGGKRPTTRGEDHAAEPEDGGYLGDVG
jgi:hypothetical protein